MAHISAREDTAGAILDAIVRPDRGLGGGDGEQLMGHYVM